MEYDIKTFYDGLVAAGLIIPGRVQGVFARGAVFEDVLEHTNALIARTSQEKTAELVVMPPVIDRQIIEKTGYNDSFPHLAGTVFSFFGKDKQAKELSAKIHAGEPWGDSLAMSEVCLAPAACYPVYPMVGSQGPLPEGGRTITLTSWVFRHEPSPEPTRLQSFRMREYIRIGTPDSVVEWRDVWLTRGLELLRDLGLPADTDVAADPFFGRAGKMLADGQKQQKLKFEVLIPVISAESPTACSSFNYHQDHFGGLFDIRTADGEVAHTACLGFGLERVTMALFRHHGFTPSKWPAAVRARLWP